MGEPINKGIMVGANSKKYFMGNEAVSSRGILKLAKPI